MSSLNYLSAKRCTCCNARLDRVDKCKIRRVNNNEMLTKLNCVKNTILINDKKPLNDIEIKINDVICNRCLTYARKYGTIVTGISTPITT